MYAAQNGNIAAAAILVQRKADLDAQNEVSNEPY